MQNHNGGRPGFKLFKPDPVLYEVQRDKELGEVRAKQLENELKQVHEKVAMLWNGWGALKNDKMTPNDFAQEHLRISKRLVAFSKHLERIDDELQGYKAGARKGRLTGMEKTVKNLFKEVGERLVFTTKDGFSNRAVAAGTPEEMVWWISIMSAHDRASLLALRMLAEQFGDTVIDNAEDLQHDITRFGSRIHTLDEGRLTVKLDLMDARRQVRRLPRDDPSRANIEKMLRDLKDESKKAKKSKNKKMRKANEELKKANAQGMVMAKKQVLLRRVATLAVLVLSGTEMILSVSNIIKIRLLDIAGGAGILVAAGLLGFDAVQEGTNAKTAFEERKAAKAAEAKVEDKALKIEQDTFVDRGRQARRWWPLS